MMGPFTKDERREILNNYFLLTNTLEFYNSEDSCTVEKEQFQIWYHQLSELWEKYRHGLFIIPLSRCPFTDDIVKYSFDPYGLDGLWWNYHNPVRLDVELPPTFQALTGSLRITPPIEKTPFLVKPGPEIPYVLPRILSCEGVKAVLYSHNVGNHIAYIVMYFSEISIDSVLMPNLWGTSLYKFIDQSGAEKWYESEILDSEMDFSLEPWIEKGKLFWINKDDEDMLLQCTIQNCPYLSLFGERRQLRIENGTVWF